MNRATGNQAAAHPRRDEGHRRAGAPVIGLGCPEVFPLGVAVAAGIGRLNADRPVGYQSCSRTGRSSSRVFANLQAYRQDSQIPLKPGSTGSPLIDSIMFICRQDIAQL